MAERYLSLTNPFDEDGYSRLVLPNISEEQTQKEVSRIKEALALPKGARVLDLGCGNGRHSLILAEDYQVTGIDLSSKLINLAQKQAERSNPPPLFIQADMRRLPFANSSFDSAFNLFTSFGFYGKEKDSLIIKEVGRVLVPSARILLEVFLKDPTVRLPYAYIWRIQNLTIQDIWSFEEETSLLTVTRYGSDLTQALLRLYLYSEDELTQMFSAASLKVVGRNLQPATESVPLKRFSLVGEKTH